MSRFQTTCDGSEFSFFAQPRQKIAAGINLDYKKTFFEIHFLRLFHTEIILKDFDLTTCKETEKQSLKPEGRRLITQVKTD